MQTPHIMLFAVVVVVAVVIVVSVVVVVIVVDVVVDVAIVDVLVVVGVVHSTSLVIDTPIALIAALIIASMICLRCCYQGWAQQLFKHV
jgi:hypothetical protein